MELRRYILDWHPWGNKRDLYLSGSQEDFQKLDQYLTDIHTPEFANSKEHLLQTTQATGAVIAFITSQTKLEIHPVAHRTHAMIFEKSNKKPDEKNQIEVCQCPFYP